MFCWDQVLHLRQGKIKALFKNKDITLRFVSGTVHFPLCHSVFTGIEKQK